ncbi:MAG: hypothetical protein LBF61_09430 [Azoarcus sp.]|jgi:hypothetical protein|nr:hypothetical protein [Azoarcus sp.]
MTPAQPALAAQTPATGGGVTINVYPAPGMDEKALAELVARKIQDTRLTDAARGRSRLTDAD